MIRSKKVSIVIVALSWIIVQVLYNISGFNTQVTYLGLLSVLMIGIGLLIKGDTIVQKFLNGLFFAGITSFCVLLYTTLAFKYYHSPKAKAIVEQKKYINKK